MVAEVLQAVTVAIVSIVVILSIVYNPDFHTQRKPKRSKVDRTKSKGLYVRI